MLFPAPLETLPASEGSAAKTPPFRHQWGGGCYLDNPSLLRYTYVRKFESSRLWYLITVQAWQSHRKKTAAQLRLYHESRLKRDQFSFVRSFARSFVRLFVFMFVCSLVSLLVRSLIQSCVHSVCLFVLCLFVCWLVCLFVRSFVCLLVNSLVRLFVLSFVSSFVLSFVRSFVYQSIIRKYRKKLTRILPNTEAGSNAALLTYSLERVYQNKENRWKIIYVWGLGYINVVFENKCTKWLYYCCFWLTSWLQEISFSKELTDNHW